MVTVTRIWGGLPDGNLNNPSLTWLRRWCEGKARILGVVSLPEETFSSAKATVKASLVFLRRFTEADETAWEAAWAKAHSDHDATFNAQRDTLCGDLGRKVVTAEDAKVEDILAELAKLGVERTIPAWTAGPEPDYPRGIGSTRVGKPKWNGTASDAKEATKLKRDYTAAFDADTQKRSDAFWRDLTAGLRAIDAVTSTGDTGDSVPNELPALLEAYRAFETWVEAGAKPEDTPGFLLPSAA